jgi:hypothetical protein
LQIYSAASNPGGLANGGYCAGPGRAAFALADRRRYPRTKSHLVGEALDNFFRQLGFEQFCVQKEPSWKKSPSEF